MPEAFEAAVRTLLRGKLQLQVLLAGVCTMIVSSGIWYSYSAFLVALIDEFGGNRGIASGVFSTFVIVFALSGPWVGSLVDRLGPQRVMGTGALLAGAGLAISGLSRSPWQLYLSYGVMASVGNSAMGWIPSLTVIHRWFLRRRGLAMGIVSAGAAGGIIFVVPFTQFLVQAVGWRMGYLIFALVPVGIVFPLAALLIRFPSGSADLRRHDVPAEPRSGHKPAANETDTPWTRALAIRHPAFWFLGLAFYSTSFVSQTMLMHQVAHLRDRGFLPGTIAGVVALVGIASIAGKVGAGWLSDRIGRRVTYALGLTALVGAVVLALLIRLEGPPLHYLYGLLLGLGYGTHTLLPPTVTANRFPGKHFGAIFGALNMVSNLGGATGVWVAGYLHDRTGAYTLPFLITIGLIVAAASAFRAGTRSASPSRG